MRARNVMSQYWAPAVLTLLGLGSAWLHFWGGDLHRFTQWIAAYIALFIGHFAIYLTACYVVLRGGRLSRNASFIAVAIVLVFGAVFRAQLVSKRPYLSSDAYRYVWDGQVQAAGINPYRYRPSAPELEHLRDKVVYPWINRGDYAETPYPPVAQAIYLSVVLIRPFSVTAFKAAMSLFDVVTMLAVALLLLRLGLEPSRVVILAWHPLLIFESAHSGHIETAYIAMLALAVVAWSRARPMMAGIALGAAALVKFYPGLLLPLFLVKPGSDVSGEGGFLRSLGRAVFNRFSVRVLAAFAVTVILAYIPYLTVGSGVFGSLDNEVAEEGFTGDGGRYFLLALARRVVPFPSVAFTVAGALAVVAAGLWLLAKSRRDAGDLAAGALALIGLFLFITSPRYPWYYAWLVPFLCFAPRLGWIYLTGATVLLYLLWYTPWEYPDVPLWLGAALFVPAASFLAWEGYRKRRIARGVSELATGWAGVVRRRSTR
jgi:hypothetical protein